MKTILIFTSISLLPLQALANGNGCELFGKNKPIGTEILITDKNGESHEMLCAKVAELHYVNGKAKIKHTQPKWAKKITDHFGEDCW